MKTYEGDVFIVPNGLLEVTDKHLDPNGIWDASEVAMFQGHKDELFVQVWMSNSDCDNWSDHFYDVRYGHLPISLFDGKEEGDAIEFEALTTSWKGSRKNRPTPEKCMVKLTLKQLDYRYRRFGKFEDVLARLLDLHTAKAA